VADIMAVQILNDMPDAAVHHGDRDYDLLRELNIPRRKTRISGRAVFLAATIGLHVIAAAAFMSARYDNPVQIEPDAIMAVMMEMPQSEAEAPPEYVPPPVNVVYSLPAPQELSFETEAIAPEVVTAAIAPSQPQSVAPPLVEEIDYVRAPTPVYPRESTRKRERGTVLLRVLVDALGHPSQIEIERSSGFDRLDNAAREAVGKALFRPHEVNGIAQPAQVLIPIEFTSRAT
jgi:periplasmic protein TonB